LALRKPQKTLKFSPVCKKSPKKTLVETRVGKVLKIAPNLVGYQSY
jgi:hypothetical protein